jgi:pimeloyl-ACP methyl ester carboxylesterase
VVPLASVEKLGSSRHAKAQLHYNWVRPAGDDDIVTMILLIHGGLWDDAMNADRFWHKPGVVAGLERRGFDVLAPDRMPRPPDWMAEADHLMATNPNRPVAAVVAGSNGCSAAVRLVLARPDRVPRLLLAWPATAGDPEVDAEIRFGLAELGEPDSAIDTRHGCHIRGGRGYTSFRDHTTIGVITTPRVSRRRQAPTRGAGRQRSDPQVTTGRR